MDGADWVKMVVKTTKYEHKNVVVNRLQVGNVKRIWWVKLKERVYSSTYG